MKPNRDQKGSESEKNKFLESYYQMEECKEQKIIRQEQVFGSHGMQRKKKKKSGRIELGVAVSTLF